MSKIKSLYDKNLLLLSDSWIADTNYEVIMGSFAYGVSSDTSDCDLYAITVPPKEIVFPHFSENNIPGFGPSPKNFKVTQQHHIQQDNKEYDVAIYSIVSFFDLAAENNPNIVDSLFVPDRCILVNDPIGKIMRENRRKFLHKGSWWRYKGYAYQQMKKIKNKTPTGNRIALVEKHGWDTKFGYHIFRLILEAQDILMNSDLDLECNRELLKSVRAGEWSLQRAEEWFIEKEKQLDQLYIDSKLQNEPNYTELRKILMYCLEQKYGSISSMVSSDEYAIVEKYKQIKKIIES